MSLSIRDPEQREFLEEILLFPAPANAMIAEYLVGELDLTDVVAEAEWGRTDDERPAQELILRVKDSIDPEEIRNEYVRVYLNIGDIRIVQFSGQVLSVATGRVRTEIRAVTAGYWLDKQRFPGSVSYANVSPSEVVYDCVRRMTRYDLAWMDLEEVGAPKFKAVAENVFDLRNKLSDPVGQAVASAELFFYDSAYNAPVLRRDRSAAEATEFLYEYVVGEDIDGEEFVPEIAGDEYYAVAATREVNGRIEDLFEPILIPDSTAPQDAVYEVEISDDTDDAGKDAHTLAVEAANRFRMGGATVSFAVDWIHPLLVDGDFILITEPFIYGAKSGHRRWAAKVVRQRKTHERRQLFESVEMVKLSLNYDEPPRVPQLPGGAPELPGPPAPPEIVGRVTKAVDLRWRVSGRTGDNLDLRWAVLSSVVKQDSDLRLTFASPPLPLVVGAGLQEFRIEMRKVGTGPNPTFTAYLYEASAPRATLVTAQAITSTTGQVFAYTWNADLLSDPSGAGVELRITTDGVPTGYAEVVNVEWNATYGTTLTLRVTKDVDLRWQTLATGGLFPSNTLYPSDTLYPQ